MRHVLVVLSDAVPGREDEYNDWYTGTHLREIVETPGFVAAQRFRLVSPSDDPAPHSYLAIYEIEGDLDEAREALAAGSASRGPVPDAMAQERKVWWFTSVSDRVVRSERIGD